MSKPKVLVNSSDTPKAGLDLLQARCDVTVLPELNPTRQQILDAVPGHDAIYLAVHAKIDSAFLDAAGASLKVVSTMSAGYDHLDVPEIKRRGIKVGHTPGVLSSAVSEIAVMLILNAARRAHEGRQLLEAGKTENRPQWLLGRDLRDSTVGIVGLGNIGQEIVKKLIPFEVSKFLYSGHSKKKAGDDLGAIFVSLDQLLADSDFVIVATPLTDETRGLFDDNTFNKMKKTAIFVNVARGAIVKTDALLKALKNRTIFAAAVDVTDPEPLPTDHELFTLPNFEVLPHLGSATIKTRNDMATVAAKNLLNALDGQPQLHPL